MNRLIVRELLSSSGLTIDEAENGRFVIVSATGQH